MPQVNNLKGGNLWRPGASGAQPSDNLMFQLRYLHFSSAPLEGQSCDISLFLSLFLEYDVMHSDMFCSPVMLKCVKFRWYQLSLKLLIPQTTSGKCWISFWRLYKRHLQSLDRKQRQIVRILFLITVFYSIHLLNSYHLRVLLCYQGNDNEWNQRDNEESRDEYRCTSRDVVGRPHDF